MIERPPPAEDVYAIAERRAAARALLRHPLLVADGPHTEDLARVRRHREALAATFADALGYRLEVEPGAARLFKPGLGNDPTHPLLRRNGRPFSPRAYAMLCLVVAALARCKDQLLVDELVAEVRSAAADANLDVDLDTAADRRALHAALLALLDMGILRERDGDLSRWGEDARAQSLLDVRRERLPLLVAAALGTVDEPEQLLRNAALPSAAGGARVAVRRRLVESPVLSSSDLTDEQAEWWRRNRNRERDRLRDLFGLELELRAEGAAAIDPQGELSDDDFPGVGSAKHYTLLLLERLTAGVRESALPERSVSQTWHRLPAQTVHALAEEVHATHADFLRRAHRESPSALLTEARQLLEAFGLLRVENDGSWSICAAGARYAARPGPGDPAANAGAGSADPTLFDEDEQ